MRTLIIGMDGAQVDTFKRGWTPFIESLIQKGEQLSLKEELVTRGWSEIVTGCGAELTGALYDRAVLNGTYEWNLKFCLGDIPDLGNTVKPIWQVLNERGYSVGIMNVPTTYPAPKVNGFLVSGGGGGRSVVQDPVGEQCHPPEILTTLQNIGYIVDERISSLLAEKKLHKAKDFFGRLVEKNDKRTKAFVELSKKYDVDFGFVVYKSSSNLAEFVLLPEWDRFVAGDSSVDIEFVEAVKQYYQEFDESIRMLVNEFTESEIILVSDHSMAKREWSVNTNIFLQESGFQNRSNSQRGVYEFVKRFKKLLPFRIRQHLRNTPSIKKAYESLTPFNTATSSAFSMIISDNVRGIYINDADRFGGPVVSSEKALLIKEIVEAFNENPESKKHRLHGYASLPINSDAFKYYPDIIIQVPDGYVTSNESMQFISKYTIPNSPLGIPSITKGALLCGKAHKPIAVTTSNKWQVETTNKKQDLRLIYDHVLQVFRKPK